MKRIPFFLLFLSALATYCQVPISQLPTHTGNPAGGLVPITIGGVTKKIDASSFGWGKVDSVRIKNDSLFYYRLGIKVFGGVVSLPPAIADGNNFPLTLFFSGPNYTLTRNDLAPLSGMMDTNYVASKPYVIREVDSRFANFGGGSGIDRSGNNFHLGAPLTRNAIITGQNYGVFFGNATANPIGTFGVYTRQGVYIQDTISSGVAPYFQLLTGNATLHGRSTTIRGVQQLYQESPTMIFHATGGMRLTGAVAGNVFDTVAYKLLVRNVGDGSLRSTPWPLPGNGNNAFLNGLSLSGNTVNLGGALTQPNTYFSGRNGNVFFGASTNFPIGSFNVNTRQGILLSDSAAGGNHPYIQIAGGDISQAANNVNAASLNNFSLSAADSMDLSANDLRITGNGIRLGGGGLYEVNDTTQHKILVRDVVTGHLRTSAWPLGSGANNFPNSLNLTSADSLQQGRNGLGPLSVFLPYVRTVSRPAGSDSVYRETGSAKQLAFRLPKPPFAAYTPIHKVEAGSISRQTQPVVLNGAMSSAFIGNDFQNDIISVGTGDENSWIRFSDRLSTIQSTTIRLRIKVDSMGANALLGIRLINAPLQFTSYVFGDRFFYFNMQSRSFVSSTYGNGDTATSNSIAAIAAGDVLELTLERLVGDQVQFSLKKEGLTGEAFTFRASYNTPGDDNPHPVFPAIILTSGTYKILAYEEVTRQPVKPLVMLNGDSMGAGYSVAKDNTIFSYLKTKMPYPVASNAASACKLTGSIAAFPEIAQLQPSYLVMFNYLEPLFYGYANPANAEHAAFLARLKSYIARLKAIGCKPVFVKVASWPVSSTTLCNQWSTMIDTYFPSELVLDLRSVNYQYDATTYHYAAPTNELIANMIISLLRADGAFTNR